MVESGLSWSDVVKMPQKTLEDVMLLKEARARAEKGAMDAAKDRAKKRG